MEFLFTYHPAWLILTTIIAFGYAFFLYRKDELLQEVSAGIKWTLAAFRFLYVWGILFLLLGLILENFVDRKEKPLIFVVQDNSESVLLTKDSTFYKGQYLKDLEGLSSQLSEEYEVINYSFDENLNEGLGGDYSGKLTDISTVFNTIFDQYTNRNIGAVILSTDGIYNSGSNPVYVLSRKAYLPIFTVGLGDTTEVRDVRLDEVNHNDIAFLGNQFPVEVSFSQAKCIGEPLTIGIYEGDKLIEEQSYVFKSASEQGKVVFMLDADKVGFRKYTAKISALDGEFSLKNNVANFYLEIIDGRQKVLLTYSGPHPDINALRYVIENNKNYEVETMNLKEVDNTAAYDLIIVHNYTSTNPLVDQTIEEGSTPCLLINGLSTEMNALRGLKMGFSGSAGQSEEVGFASNPSFKEILVNPEIIQLFSSAPPLHAPFGNLSFSNAIDVLAYQKVGNIQLDQPLIYFTKKGGNRMGMIMGEGIWRWRLYDQMKNNSTQNFEEFFDKLITFLAIKENKDPFRIKLGNEFTENQNVIVEAELYNKSFELINDPEVQFTYTNESGKSFESYFVRTGNTYRLDLGKLNQGIYEWTAQTNFQGNQYEKSGTFLVKEVKVELLNSQANHRLLRNMAENSGGKFFLPNQLDQLKSEIDQRDDLVTVVYQEKSFNDMIDKKWLFWLIILLISAEWFLRKFNGAY
ncbi:MAG: hypothetical protein MI810_09230 [Flavobacteriales bacterium]|nr:hypothetical protein [Flavobacteriales bacterium]